MDSSLDLAYQICDRDLLGADLRALPQGPAAPGTLFVIENGGPLGEALVPRVEQIAEGADKSGRPHVLCGFRVLVYRARRGAAGAENAAHRTLQQAGVFRGLPALIIGRGHSGNEVGFNGAVPFKKWLQVDDEVLDNPEHGQGFDEHFRAE